MKNTKQAIKEAADSIGEQIKLTKEGDFAPVSKGALQESFKIKRLAGVSDAKEESIYGQAYLLYNTGRYKDAAEVFRILVALDGMEPKYMMGLAACFHMLKAYESAIASYSICSAMAPGNPVPHFHLSDCYLKSKDIDSAKMALEKAIRNSGDKPEYKTLKERCEITLNGLTSQHAAAKKEEDS